MKRKLYGPRGELLLVLVTKRVKEPPPSPPPEPPRKPIGFKPPKKKES